MKVYLHHNHEDVLSGYNNICLGETDDRCAEIDVVIDDAEAIEIIANNVLEYVPQSEVIEFLTKIVNKLQHGGTLIITGVDAYTAAKDFVSYKISIEYFNALLHGGQEGGEKTKHTTLTLHGMVNFLQTRFGLKIISKVLEEHNFSIEAQRP